MEAYIYQAAMLCEKCGEKLRANLIRQGKGVASPENEETYDSDDFPKGPYSDGGGEADYPQHCDKCLIFLENPLTTDGYKYVRESAIEWGAHRHMPKPSKVIDQWLTFYEIPMCWDVDILRYNPYVDLN